jgi:hypothetical protein
MTRPRTLPEDNRELERLLRKHTQQEIADMFGVSNQAVSKAIRERKLSIPQRASYKLPWPVKTEHSDDYPRRMLRLYAKQQAGVSISAKDASMLARFCATLDERNLVVHYDPWHEDGPWFYLPRRPGIDVGYVRNPDVL